MKRKFKKVIIIVLSVIIGLMVLEIVSNIGMTNINIEEINYDKAQTMIETGEILRIECDKNSNQAFLYTDKEELKSVIPGIEEFNNYLKELKTSNQIPKFDTIEINSINHIKFWAKGRLSKTIKYSEAQEKIEDGLINKIEYQKGSNYVLLYDNSGKKFITKVTGVGTFDNYFEKVKSELKSKNKSIPQLSFINVVKIFGSKETETEYATIRYLDAKKWIEEGKITNIEYVQDSNKITLYHENESKLICKIPGIVAFSNYYENVRKSFIKDGKEVPEFNVLDDTKFIKANAGKFIGYSEAQEMIENGEITSIDFDQNGDIATLYSVDDKEFSTHTPGIQAFSLFFEDTKKTLKKEKKTIPKLNIFYSTDINIANTISSLFSVVFYVLMGVIMIRMFVSSKGAFADFIGKKNKASTDVKTNKTFADVAGIDQELLEVQEVVDILKNPRKYKAIGAKVPKGVLLSGEPGTGKTLIAKAIAGEAKVKFYHCAGSSFDNMFVGVGADKVRQIFNDAKKNAPAIIFIDEFDTIAKTRYTSHDYHEQTLNQLLSEMDGFEETDNIIVIAATNHYEVLDPAITRPGRFDRIINIPLPDKKGRRAILDVHSRGKSFEDDKDEFLDELAKKTSGMSGAILENILNEAAIIAVRQDRKRISKEDIHEAFIKVILGISKDDKEVSDEQRYLVSVHEAGHAITSRITRPDIEILEASIIPRGMAGGYTLFADKEKSLPTKSELLNDIVVSLGGRAAEIKVFSTVSVGASNDLQQASKLAHRMIYDYAMAEDKKNQLVKIYGEEDYNENLEDSMYPAMEKVVSESFDKALKIMEDNKDLLEEIATHLMEKSTLDSSELEEIFSKFGV